MELFDPTFASFDDKTLPFVQSNPGADGAFGG